MYSMEINCIKTLIWNNSMNFLGVHINICKVLNPGEGHSNPLQYSCLENPLDRGAWQAAIHEVSKSQTWLKWLSTQHTKGVKSGLDVYPPIYNQVCPGKKRWYLGEGQNKNQWGAAVGWHIKLLQKKEFKKFFGLFVDRISNRIILLAIGLFLTL